MFHTDADSPQAPAGPGWRDPKGLLLGCHRMAKARTLCLGKGGAARIDLLGLATARKSKAGDRDRRRRGEGLSAAGRRRQPRASAYARRTALTPGWPRPRAHAPQPRPFASLSDHEKGLNFLPTPAKQHYKANLWPFIRRHGHLVSGTVPPLTTSEESIFLSWYRSQVRNQ